MFSDVTIRSGVGPATRPYVGFGVVFFDYDNDGRLDLAIVNGHVMANVAQVRGRRQARAAKAAPAKHRRAFRGRDEAGRSGFRAREAWAARSPPATSTTTEISICSSPTTAGAPNLLLNDGGNANAVLVQVVGTTSNRSGIGTRLTLDAGRRRQMREVQSGASYLAQNDLRAHFGLGAATRAERLEVRWPSGVTEVVADLPANHVYTLREGDGVVGRVPLRLR